MYSFATAFNNSIKWLFPKPFKTEEVHTCKFTAAFTAIIKYFKMMRSVKR